VKHIPICIRYAFLLLLSISCKQYVAAQTDSLAVDTIAIVDGTPLLRSEFEAQQQYDNQEAAKQNRSDKGCKTLEEQLHQKLLLTQAIKAGIKVDDSWVESELKRRLQYFANYFDSEEKMAEFYGKPLDELHEEFRAALGERYLMQEMERKVYSDIKVSQNDVKQFFESIPEDSLPLIESKFEIAQLEKHLEASKEEKKKAYKKLKELRKQIVKGEKQFSVVSVLHSMDPGTAKTGGDLGWQGKGIFVPEFEKQALGLKKGEISKVFETQYGYHIIELIDRKGDKFHCKHILLIPEVKQEEVDKVKEELNGVYAKIVLGQYSFEEAVKRYSDDEEAKERGGLVLNSESHTDSSLFTPAELDMELFKVIDKMEVGEVSPVQEYTRNGKPALRLISYKRFIPPHVANLKYDFITLRNAALKQKQNEAMQQWIQKTIPTVNIWLKKEFHTCKFAYNWVKK
jgi:peptidyl-prolyl cis-trans isomerase SurA